MITNDHILCSKIEDEDLVKHNMTLHYNDSSIVKNNIYNFTITRSCDILGKIFL